MASPSHGLPEPWPPADPSVRAVALGSDHPVRVLADAVVAGTPADLSGFHSGYPALGFAPPRPEMGTTGPLTNAQVLTDFKHLYVVCKSLL